MLLPRVQWKVCFEPVQSAVRVKAQCVLGIGVPMSLELAQLGKFLSYLKLCCLNIVINELSLMREAVLEVNFLPSKPKELQN